MGLPMKRTSPLCIPAPGHSQNMARRSYGITMVIVCFFFVWRLLPWTVLVSYKDAAFVARIEALRESVSVSTEQTDSEVSSCWPARGAGVAAERLCALLGWGDWPTAYVVAGLW